MVLTFTGSLSAAESGHAEVRAMLIGALGCNLAWGLIDAIMYLMSSLAERAADQRMIAAVQRAATAAQAGNIVARRLPAPVVTLLAPADPGKYVSASRACLIRPLGWFLNERTASQGGLWWSCPIPVVLPFASRRRHGGNASLNAIAVAMMFVTGYAFGRAMDTAARDNGRLDGSARRALSPSRSLRG
jgi:hypothetical protein